ncbi:YceG-like family [Bifidobacterium lemurum]|uniref:Endolytic murein transglycosylase n=1 Tax=Bifidobacterium lemurum TaxID=1603886 RepID=A0A261FM11_9BIFI|nr:endolytic transglycosylase MltG [Bifidobacterium lemurum]OZG60222.1 YceG-like family [Bifidobacterium lemurum]QOL34119.1 endolytic transglycosylase MltG [Bifidobacterium lemurum]
MSDSFNDFFDENTQWVDPGETPLGAEPPRPPKSRKEMRKRREQRARKRVVRTIIVIVVLALLAAGGYFGYRALAAWSAARNAQQEQAAIQDYPGPGGEEVLFTVQQGEGATQIAENLVEADIVKSAAAFTTVVAANNLTLYPGTYTLRLQMAAADVANILSDQTNASGFLEVRPGDRVSAVIANAVLLTDYTESDFESVVNGGGDGILPSEAEGSFEGWLEPGTYDVQNKTVTEILQEMVDARIAKLDDLGVAADQRQRVLKIASIAEAEVNREEYYGKVTRVIENRLEIGMNLGMDTSLAYGLGKSASEITDADIADESNLYNLHNHEGLPPTPISNPGDNALEAAINPEEGDWLYFVTVDLSTGETKFVSTEDEFWQIRDEYKNNNENAN